VYGARNFAFLIENDAGSAGSVHGDQVNGNAFETSAAAPPVDYSSAVDSSTNIFGTYNNNLFCHPSSNYVVQNQSINYNLLNWQSFSGQDLSSTDLAALCPTQVPTLVASTGTAADGTTLINWSSSNATSCTGVFVAPGAVMVISLL
jgi:hypothetical protein